MICFKACQFCFKHGRQSAVPSMRSIVRYSNSMSAKLTASPYDKPADLFQDALSGTLQRVWSSDKFAEIPEVSQWLKKVIGYNLAGGKKNRGLTTVFAYEMFEKPNNITKESLELARIMGWCVELMQAYFLILDDIMDGSETRRGVPCWYKSPGVGISAINDTVLIQSMYYSIIKQNFGKKTYYTDVINLFNETLFNTSIGQHLDVVTAKREKHDFSMFTMNRYNSIAKYKTAYYTYKLPVCLGLLMTNNIDQEAHDRCEKICVEIGLFFQIQDDYIDCFGDPAITGKIGTDIQEGKCSWLAVAALEHCTPAQRSVFTSCYGSREPAHVERIRRLYDELDLPSIYRDNERTSYDSIRRQIEQLPPRLSQELFIKLLDTINMRKY